MGVVIQAESRTVEFAAAYLMDHDPLVLEFWDQPNPPITLRYPVKQKNGRTRTIGVLHTPDYFVIREKVNDRQERKTELGWEEWKTEEELLRFESEGSHRYVRDGEGQWRCPPGEAVAVPLGLYYRVRSSAEIHETFQRNLRFLSYYLRENSPHVAAEAKEEVLSLVKHEPGITLGTLLSQIKLATSDAIYTLLAQEAIYVDVYRAPLAESEQVVVWSDEKTARAWSVALEQSPPARSCPHTIQVSPGVPVVWDGRRCTILYQGQTTITLLTEDGQPVELSEAHFHALVTAGKVIGLTASQSSGSQSQKVRERMMQADKAALTEASRRWQIIAPLLEGSSLAHCSVPARTVRRWVSRYREAAETLGCGYVGLLPKVQERGNRQPRLKEQVISILNQFIDQEYENHKQKNKREVYGEFVNFCQDKGLATAPSYKTFVSAINRRPRYEQAKKRKGERAAYPNEPKYWELSYELPRHGDRPFEVVHIDHTLLDVELVDAETRRHFGRPWATFLTDAFSRRILSVYVTFDEPSYRSCMMILRECVHRYHRFPELVVVDWGPEFESVYFETLLARYECSKASRPKAKPRFGSVIERLFHTANTTFIHNLAGNTQVMKNVRQVTRSVNPRGQAIWTLGALYAELRRWAYEVYDTTEHRTLGQTPKEAFEMGLLQTGSRPKQWIEYDEDFIQFTLPSTRKGTAKLVPGKGVKIHNIFYWARDNVFLDHPELENKQIPVRYDPYDVGHVFVLITGHRQPVECISEHHAQFKGRSERELQIATEELRKRHRLHSQQFTITAARMARFITSLEAQEVLLDQRKRDYEAEAVFALMEGRRQLAVPESASPSTTGEVSQRSAERAKVPQDASWEQESSGITDDNDIYDDF
jgi:transposase InsO family protein